MQCKNGRLAAAGSLSVACALSGATPLTLHVDDDAAPGGDGLSWSTAYRTLQDAIDHELGPTADPFIVIDIKVAGGRYTGRNGPDDSSLAAFTREHPTSYLRYRVFGGYIGLATGPDDFRDPSSYPTVIDGDTLGDDDVGDPFRPDNHHVLVAIDRSTSHLELNGMTIRGAQSDIAGLSPFFVPNISDTASALVLKLVDINLIDNVGTERMLLDVYNGSHRYVSVEMTRCTVTGNTGQVIDARPGPNADSYGSFTCTDSVFADNRFPSGVSAGGHTRFDVLIDRTIFAAGGIAGESSSGLALRGSATVRNCLFIGGNAFGSTAVGVGNGGDVDFQNCTFSGAPVSLGPSPVPAAMTVVSMTNCVFAESRFEDRPSIVIQGTRPGWVILDHCILEGGESAVSDPGEWGGVLYGMNVRDTDPRFVVPFTPGMSGWREADYRPAAGSPMIDAGTGCIDTGSNDIAGQPRRVNAVHYADTGVTCGEPPIDLGCYEVRTNYTAPCTADLAQPYGVLDLADITAFVDAFSSSDPLADLAMPFGVFDLADITVFVDSFGAGCP